MKSFLGKIIQAIWSFVLLVVAGATKILCRFARKQRHVTDNIAASLPENKSWLAEVDFLIFSILKGKRELTVALPRKVAPISFLDLEITACFTVRSPDQPQKIHFKPDIEKMWIVAGRLHALPLVPATEKDKSASESIKGNRNKTRPANLGRIELRLGHEERVFHDSELGQFFPERLRLSSPQERATTC